MPPQPDPGFRFPLATVDRPAGARGGVYCEIHPYDMNEQALRVFHPRGVMFSGSPESLTAEAGPRAHELVFELGMAVLGI